MLKNKIKRQTELNEIQDKMQKYKERKKERKVLHFILRSLFTV